MSQVAYQTGAYFSFSKYKVTRSIVFLLVPGWDANLSQARVTSQH